MMLSHDWSVLATMMSQERLAQRPLADPDDYLFTPRNALPMLRQLGATHDQVDGLTIDNPRRFFEGNA